METMLIVVMLFIVLDIVSLHWGYDSREKIDSPEWERRVVRHLKEATPPGVKSLGERVGCLPNVR